MVWLLRWIPLNEALQHFHCNWLLRLWLFLGLLVVDCPFFRFVLPLCFLSVERFLQSLNFTFLLFVVMVDVNQMLSQLVVAVVENVDALVSILQLTFQLLDLFGQSLLHQGCHSCFLR